MNDALILELVTALNGEEFQPDSTTLGTEFFAADVAHKLGSTRKIFRIIWLHEGDKLEILGIVNAYRRNKKVK